MLIASVTKPVSVTPAQSPQLLSPLNKILIPLLILVVIIAILFIAATIVLAVLYGIERNKTRDLQMMQTTTTTKTTISTTTTTTLPTMTTISTTKTAASTTSSMTVKTMTTTGISIANNADLCLTPYCIKAANTLLQSIDETVDPCENFYQFSCGTYVKNGRISIGASTRDTTTDLINQVNDAIIDLLSSSTSNEIVESKAITNARHLYAACVDEAAIKANSLNDLLQFVNNELGGWPILQGSTWDSSTFDFKRLLLKLDQHNNFIFYRVSTNKYPTRCCINIGQSDLGLHDPRYYEEESSITIAYRQYMKNLALSLTKDTSKIDDDVNDIFQFEKTISKYFYTTADLRVENRIQTTLGNLSTTINSTFDFTDYVRRIYRLADIILYDMDTVIVGELEVLRNIPLVIKQQSSRTIQNYMIWRFMMNRVENLPIEIRHMKQRFDQVFRGINALPARASTCAQYVTDNMGFVVGKLFIDQYFDKNAHNDMREMTEYHRQALIDILNQTTWMDPVSKGRAIEKAQAIYANIGYPDYLEDDNLTKLEKDYAEYNFNSSYMENVLTILQLNVKKDLQTLLEVFQPSTWFDNPTVVNAFYDDTVNSITLPAAQLQPYFYNKDAPNYLNYGGMGSVIGHEMTHGFDSNGRLFDKDGNFVTWWTKETIKEFNQRKQCIIDEYNNYIAAQVNLQINGVQTQNENIADIGGLKVAFFAYQKWVETHPYVDKKLPGLSKYSAEQLFFINYGWTWCEKDADQHLRHQILTNEHSPSLFRVLGPTSNFVEFDRAFNCTPGQGNSRVKKCALW